MKQISTVSQLVKCLLCNWEGGGLIPGRVIPKTFNIILALLFGAQHEECRARNQNWSAWCQYNVTGWNIMACVWGMIFQ